MKFVSLYGEDGLPVWLDADNEITPRSATGRYAPVVKIIGRQKYDCSMAEAQLDIRRAYLMRELETANHRTARGE